VTCERVRDVSCHDGLKGKTRVVGKGHAKPVASDKSKAGRAANRRVVVSFTF
jgi:outer membrane protein OmpA-like peptidoglycan-associated protein